MLRGGMGGLPGKRPDQTGGPRTEHKRREEDERIKKANKDRGISVMLIVVGFCILGFVIWMLI